MAQTQKNWNASYLKKKIEIIGFDKGSVQEKEKSRYNSKWASLEFDEQMNFQKIGLNTKLKEAK